jgi:small subunit ribosomal protein S18
MAENEATTSEASPRPGDSARAERVSGPGRSAGGGDGGGGPRRERSGSEHRPRSGGGKRFFRRRKVDYFSVNKIDHIEYKDVDTLKQFVGDRGKINPRRHTGLSAKHQRELRRAIKRARNIALLPFAGVVEKVRAGSGSDA